MGVWALETLILLEEEADQTYPATRWRGWYRAEDHFERGAVAMRVGCAARLRGRGARAAARRGLRAHTPARLSASAQRVGLARRGDVGTAIHFLTGVVGAPLPPRLSFGTLA